MRCGLIIGKHKTRAATCNATSVQRFVAVYNVSELLFYDISVSKVVLYATSAKRILAIGVGKLTGYSHTVCCRLVYKSSSQTEQMSKLHR